MKFLKRTWAEIDIAALLHNLNVIKENAGGKEIMAVIKADAYCHSTEIVAKVLWENGVCNFAVSNIDEAVELREMGVGGHILILGYTPTANADLLIEHNISQAVYALEYAKELSFAAQKSGKTINIHLKLDTGMGRIGFDCRNEGLAEIVDALEAARLPYLNAEGVFTHFAVSDGIDEEALEFTKKQQKLFLSAVKFLKDNGINPIMRHTNNSAALFTANDDGTNFCRPGIVLYGLTATGAAAAEDELIPVMTFKSVVSMVKTLNTGDTVSYGRTFTISEPTKVATVTAGYGDGYPRALSGKGYVVINGKPAKILGRVCMDQFMVDVSDIENVKRGDEVILFGKEPTATDVADICGMINYEIICGISKRVPRIAVENK